MKEYTTYEEFGAVGDGRHDDMQAIAQCHAYANANGLAVRARDDAHYYIGGKAITAEIRTDTDWGTARFTIDDRAVENRQQNCFRIMPDREPFSIAVKSLSKTQKTLDFPHTGTCYVSVEAAGKKVYIRKGLNRDGGFDACDRFLVDDGGKICNPINWDYDMITDAYAICVDDRPITVRGGIFTTIANAELSFYNYYERNIRIQRSHVTLCDLTHYIRGEEDQGAPYDGFISIKHASFVTVKNCLMTAHKIYWTPSQIPGQMVAMGSYDLLVNDSIQVRFEQVRQTTDIHDPAYWGIFCSNFCKELHLQDCVLSRFDAHCGVTNGSIRNCILGHQGVNLIGFGHFVMENTTVHAGRVVALRGDYGSFFCGKLTVRNCVWVPKRKTATRLSMIAANNTGDHDFGYACSMPEEILVENLTIRDDLLDVPEMEYILLPHYDPDFAADKPYPYGTPLQFTAQVRMTGSKTLRLCRDAALYPFIQCYQML